MNVGWKSTQCEQAILVQGRLAEEQAEAPSQPEASSRADQRLKIPEDGPQHVAPGLQRPKCWALRGRCPHRSTTAWIATAAALSPSPRTPVWKRGSERNAGTRGSCGWSTSWYVPRSPQTQVFLSPSADAVGKCQRSHDLGVSQSCSFQQQNPLNVFRKP